MRVAVAVVLALAIAALVTWYREWSSKQELTAKQREKCDYKEAIRRFDTNPCWIAIDQIK
jgi:hypothetical protein